MKKFFSFFAVLAVTVFFSSSVFAAVVGQPKEAYATFATASLSFNVTLHEWTAGEASKAYGTHKSTDSINFITEGVPLGAGQQTEVVSNAYIKIQSNLNQLPANTVIYMYTDNRANDSAAAAQSYNASYPYVETDTTTTPATVYNYYDGLVRKGQSSATSYTDGDYAVLKIRSLEIDNEYLSDPEFMSQGPKVKGMDFNPDHTWQGIRTLKDKGSSGWSISGEPMETVMGKSGVNGGNWVGYGEPKEGDPAINFYVGKDVLIFFDVTFKDVVAGNSYGTKSIKFVETAE